LGVGEKRLIARVSSAPGPKVIYATARAHEIPLGDAMVPIAHRDDLLKMKRASAGLQDLADLQLLESWSLGDEP